MDKQQPVQYDPLPQEFNSLAEAGAFWDAHNTADYEVTLHRSSEVGAMRDGNGQRLTADLMSFRQGSAPRFSQKFV